MDAISYAHSAKQEQRIKKFINDPDSTSGVLTVPKTIASGENITIPSGRVAVLPNVQIDGTLNVQGDVFIPSGATLSGVVEKVTSTDNAIVRFDGTTGKVQNSGVIIDDNNNVTQRASLYKRDTDNISVATIDAADGTSFSFNDYTGGGFKFNSSSISRMRIDANGNVGIGVTPSAWAAYIVIQTGYSGVLSGSNSVNELTIGSNFYNSSTGWKYINNGYASQQQFVNGTVYWNIAPSGTAGNAITWTNAMTLDKSGNLLVGANTNGMNNTTGFNVTNPSTSAYCSIGHISGTPSGVVYLNFSYNGTQIGSIYQSGTSSVVYATTSDYRLKENIRPADCKKFMDIKFVDYERIDGRHECGVIAHELQEIYPDLVTGEKDATEIRKVEISPAVEEAKDEDGNIIVEAVEAVYEEQEFPVYQQVNYMGLIARIGTVVQQQAKLIEAMRAEIDELKGIGGAK